jgi:predicted AlkP superfamily pyrophosphatase or phosphodiesterase
MEDLNNKTLSKNFLILILSGLLIITSCNFQASKDEKPYVVMLSMDGFRWDYPEIYNTPNLDKIAKKGVKLEALQPSFPTKTFPNHYTIATGLYPDHHGLVNNTYFDPERKDIFRIGDREKVEDSYYYGGEPIWVTAEKQGVKAASFFWVGSEAPQKGIFPSYWKTFNSSIPFEDRIDSVINWLKLPEDKRPHLITWYFEEPDGVGHKYGPVSPETKEMVEYLDSLVGVFISKINTLPNANKINLIFTSDHGMGETHSDKYVNILNYADTSLLKYYIGGNPVLLIQPKQGMIDSVDNLLDKVDHISSWTKDEIPERMVYGSNPRISDIVVAADSGWSIGFKNNTKSEQNNATGYDTKSEIGGAHGYDNINKDMNTIFYAYGPAFKNDYTQAIMSNTEIYGLIARILKLNPAPNDGDISHVEGLLKK